MLLPVISPGQPCLRRNAGHSARSPRSTLHPPPSRGHPRAQTSRAADTRTATARSWAHRGQGSAPCVLLRLIPGSCLLATGRRSPRRCQNPTDAPIRTDRTVRETPAPPCAPRAAPATASQPARSPNNRRRCLSAQGTPRTILLKFAEIPYKHGFEPSRTGRTTAGAHPHPSRLRSLRSRKPRPQRGDHRGASRLPATAVPLIRGGSSRAKTHRGPSPRISDPPASPTAMITLVTTRANRSRYRRTGPSSTGWTAPIRRS